MRRRALRQTAGYFFGDNKGAGGQSAPPPLSRAPTEQAIPLPPADDEEATLPIVFPRATRQVLQLEPLPLPPPPPSPRPANDAVVVKYIHLGTGTTKRWHDGDKATMSALLAQAKAVAIAGKVVIKIVGSDSDILATVDPHKLLDSLTTRG